MFTVTLKFLTPAIKNKSILLSTQVLASDLLKRYEVQLSMPCAGNHSCGKCKVMITGCISAITAEEACFLTPEEISQNIRLACFTKILGDSTIYIPECTSFIQKNFTAITKENSQKNRNGHFIVADIGTTTIVSYLYQITDNITLLSSLGELNEQRTYGADVISRIQYCNQYHTNQLHDLLIQQLENMFAKNLEEASLHPSDIDTITLTGNTTMLYFFAGYHPKSLAISPYYAKHLFHETRKADEFFPAYINSELYLPPCISAFVGADLVCSVLASDLISTEASSLLVDIGTNGEMALWHQGTLFTCSVAAGPAFEGSGISNGMTASSGAIDDLFLSNGVIRYHTIHNTNAIGICGSGVICAIALFLDAGILDETGLIQEKGHRYHKYIFKDANGLSIQLGDSKIFLTQQDIRQVQLAKSAIHAGILTLIKECNITIDQIKHFYLCGGFGSCLNIQQAERIGLIPFSLSKQIHFIGNGAGKGAILLTQNISLQLQAKNIAQDAKHISLASNEYFMEQYMEQMMFPTL